MKDVADITVTQIRVYRADDVPFQSLRPQSTLRALAKAFGFSAVAIDPLGLQITLSEGTVEAEKRSIHVTNLTLEPRRMLLQVRGPSADANAAAASFSLELTKLIPEPRGENSLQPILVNEETTCVATLDIDFSELLAPPVVKLVEEGGRSMFSNSYMSAKSIGFRSVTFEVRYEPADRSLEEHDVSLSSKMLTIEPRLGTPLKERRFFISSPTDSDTHLRLVGALEEQVLESRSVERT